MTTKQQAICDKYSAYDKEDLAHRFGCPLQIDRYNLIANSHYDNHLKEWVFGLITNDKESK